MRRDAAATAPRPASATPPRPGIRDTAATGIRVAAAVESTQAPSEYPRAPPRRGRDPPPTATPRVASARRPALTTGRGIEAAWEDVKGSFKDSVGFALCIWRGAPRDCSFSVDVSF